MFGCSSIKHLILASHDSVISTVRPAERDGWVGQGITARGSASVPGPDHVKFYTTYNLLSVPPALLFIHSLETSSNLSISDSTRIFYDIPKWDIQQKTAVQHKHYYN